jgi:hypothetical protein
VETLSAALVPGGQAIIAGFAPDGPENCTGLPVMRHDAESLGRAPDQIFGWDPSNISFVATTTAATSSGGIDYVTIDASYTFDFLFDAILGIPTKTLTATSTTPLVGQGNSFAS